jgi:hypothetical protein
MTEISSTFFTTMAQRVIKVLPLSFLFKRIKGTGTFSTSRHTRMSL